MIEKVTGKLGLGAKLGIAALIGLATYWVTFHEILYYNEAGYQAHIRTKFGTEKVADTLGYTTKWFGNVTAWPRQMTAQSVSDPKSSGVVGDMDGQGASMITSFPVTFLGGVTATVDSNVRIILPTGDQFLELARAYRNPENFMAQTLMPALQNVLQSTAQMMTADDYYSGARSEFAANFRDQISDGIYLVKRNEIHTQNGVPKKTAILQMGTDQGEFGDNTTTRFVTEKVLGENGLPIRLEQQFRKIGVSVVEANVQNLTPNSGFLERMKRLQQSQADRMLARQDRGKEEEQKGLVTARGEREVEENRQTSLKSQVTQTTEAETARQLAIITAQREQQRAEIEKKTAEVTFEKAQIEAKTIKELADAHAYEKKAAILADGALAQKLDAFVQVNKSWADAAAKAQVPGIMMGGGAGGSSAGARQSEFGDYLGVIAAKAAKDLQLDMAVKQ
jgi:regulator of protease activity HflC (stomatin/prohibitin superfamily)